MKPERPASAGFTFRSVAASIFSIVVAGAIIQFTGVTDRWGANLGSETLSPAALIPFLAILLIGSGIFALWRFRLLNRAELLCVMFSTLIAVPLMSHGLWRHMLASSMVVPRNSLFDKMDALSDKLWIHGDNLIDKHIAKGAKGSVSTRGSVEWREVEVAEGVPASVAVLSNDSAADVSAIRLRLPAENVRKNVPYVLSVQARARDLGPAARYYCRTFHDGESSFDEEAFTSRQEASRTAVHRTGFVRVGKYGVKFPLAMQEFVELEFGLVGEGTVELHDAQLMDVSCIEEAYLGRRIIDQDEFEKLPPEAQAGLTVRPRNMFSVEGLKFLFTGYFPLGVWIPPTMVWGLFVLLLFVATFAVGVIMRRQWVQNERYPLPMAQVPFALLGEDGDERRALPAIFRNRLMWMGFGITLFWCIARMGHAFNSAIPDLAINFPLKPYFTDPGWGDTWNGVNFSVYAIFLGLGLFMELNVLMSMVVGYFLFRYQFWFGEAYGLETLQDYPFGGEQMFGSFMAYALLILLFTRKYLWRVLKMAVKGERQPGEAMSYQVAFIVLIATFVGVIFWARWAGLPAQGMVGFFLYMVLVGFVATKLRAECGTVHSKFTAGILVLVPALGGFKFFAPEGVIFLSLAGLVFGYYLCLFNIPGMQLELMEAGRRVGMRPRHLVYTSLLGLVAGVVIGGWVHLSSLYSIGADNFPLKAAHFEAGGGSFKAYNTELVKATDEMVRQGTGEEVVKTVEPRVWGAVLAGVVTATLTILRQLFAGFWFHPVGFIVGSSGLLLSAWGSLLMAWFIRLMVLRLGGAATVREKLLPVAAGIFLASIAAYALGTLVNGYVYFFNQGGQRFTAEFF